MFNFRNYDGLD